VLDSIVKNVGTPYTLYLGRNLFKTFMEAYTVVDNATRKRMEEMLKTWKAPVAGSMDTRPVFSPELVRPIENALIKAKGASISQGPLPGRPRPAMPPQRDTPTPPSGLLGQPPQLTNGGRHSEPAGQIPFHAHQQVCTPPSCVPRLSLTVDSSNFTHLIQRRRLLLLTLLCSSHLHLLGTDCPELLRCRPE
jgi:pre-mRNA cleavage complex 2 protein Pcf11